MKTRTNKWLLVLSVLLFAIGVYSIFSLSAVRYQLPPFYVQRQTVYYYRYNAPQISFDNVPYVIKSTEFSQMATVETSKPVNNPNQYGLKLDHTEYLMNYWQYVVGSTVITYSMLAGWGCFVYSF